MSDSPSQAPAPTSHGEVINLWPSLTAYAEDIGADYGTAKKHRRRNSIPPNYWIAAVLGAGRRGLPITHELLASTAPGRQKECV